MSTPLPHSRNWEDVHEAFNVPRSRGMHCAHRQPCQSYMRRYVGSGKGQSQHNFEMRHYAVYRHSHDCPDDGEKDHCGSMMEDVFAKRCPCGTSGQTHATIQSASIIGRNGISRRSKQPRVL